MVASANDVELVDCELDTHTGKVRLRYRIDESSHTINAIFHDAPKLSSETWRACLHDLGLACLVDLAAASLARHVAAAEPLVTEASLSWFLPAAKALRAEYIADLGLPIRQLSFTTKMRGAGAELRATRPPIRERVMLLMGGGKDSLYSYELLRAAGFDVECFYMTEASRTWQQLRRTYSELGKEAIQHRAFLNANQMGSVECRYRRDYTTQFQVGQALFLSIPYALDRNCKYIAIGAERSANERIGNYCGVPVNHQFEKSESFLEVLNRYFEARFGRAFQVFSPVHGLFDLGIYARFLRCDRLLDLQSSCGGSNSVQRHCGRCEKCAFVAVLFAGLSPDVNAYRNLFPSDPLEDTGLFDDWYKGRFERPFACVGSLRELRVALRLGRARGWSSAIHHYDRSRGRPPGVRALNHFLAVHPNRCIPPAIQERIEPLLEFDSTALVELLGGRS
jgi:hypothetical protein